MFVRHIAFRAGAGGVLTLAILFSNSLVRSCAADTLAVDNSSHSGADELVLAALQSEAAGDLVARDRLLETAAKSDRDCAAAQWHRGSFKTEQGKWVSVESSLPTQQADIELRAYEDMRRRATETVEGQWQLAVWCLRSGYLDQGRAHLQRTIDMAPEHTGARQLLGYRRVSNQWISPFQLAEFQRRSTALRVGLQTYGKQLNQLAHDFKTRSEAVRNNARRQLLEIKDVAAIGAVEAIIAPVNAEAATAGLDWLATIADPEATRSMVRYGLFHPHTGVRDQAIAHVQKRPYYDYVPDLLEMLSLPVAAMAMPVIGPDGALTGFRQAFAQERQGQRDIFVLDTQLSYSANTALPQSNRPVPGRRASRRLQQEAPADLLSQLEAIERSTSQINQSNAQLQQENQRIVARNQMIASFIATVTDRELSTPSELWKWWDEANETEQQSLKLSNISYANSTLATRNYSELAAAAAAGPVRSHECFAKSTPVVTRKGFRAIETVRVGDLVLSRDVRTGELSWKAVVRTTIRPARPLYELSLDTETLRCTGGHLFWVSGKGWTKASQIKGGDVLHGASQPIAVMKVTPQPDEETYNLAVDQTQTYFVGKQMVLSHDVTDRVPTHIKVPGLTPSVP